MSTTNYQDAIKGYTGVIQAYAVATRTHDKLSEDAWAVMAREISAALKNGKTPPVIRTDMKAAEDTWKASTGEGAMPSTYRSAKAVALKGIEAGIDLLNEDGTPKGKTAIEKEYKAKLEAAEALAAAAGVTLTTEKDRAEEIIAKLGKYWASMTELQQTKVKEFVAGLPLGSESTTTEGE